MEHNNTKRLGLGTHLQLFWAAGYLRNYPTGIYRNPGRRVIRIGRLGIVIGTNAGKVGRT